MTPERKLEYDKAYMRMAYEFSKLSEAKRSKVGCLIVSQNGQIISQGFNGMPKGMSNECEHTMDDGSLVTNREVLHAETNAILKCAKDGGRTEGCTLYITLSPCYDCAKVIIQAGIKRVVYGEAYRDLSGLKLLEECGVEIQFLPLTKEISDEVPSLWYAVNNKGQGLIISSVKQPERSNGSWLPDLVGRYAWGLRDQSIMNCTMFGDQEWKHSPVKISK